MGQHAAVEPVEPVFDVPPRLGGLRDRRLASRAAARWTELRGAAAMPEAAHYAGDATALAGPASHDLVLDLSDQWQVVVDHAGSELVRAFGIAAGVVADAGAASLERSVLAAAAAARQRPAMAPFEALLRGTGHATPVVLTRGVLLPLGDARGRLVAAHVVVTWKEKLSMAQNRALERELRLVLADFAVAGRLNTPESQKTAIIRH